MKKAFDSVYRPFLWYKLEKLGISGKFLSALQGLYHGVKSSVKVNNILTDWFDVNSGVKQGCLLSPTLFSLFIDDLVSDINQLQCGLSVDGTNISILLYADDIALIAPDEQSMDKLLTVLNNWCEKWKLFINPTKTKVVHYRIPSHERSKHVFRCGESIIDFSDTYRYLGLWLDEHLDIQKNC